MYQRRPVNRFREVVDQLAARRKKPEPMLAADRASASDRQLLEEIYLLLHDVQRTLKAICDRHDL